MEEVGSQTLGYGERGSQLRSGAALGARINRVARAQHGLVTTRDLVRAGFDRNRIHRWVKAGRLQRLRTEVYAVGHGHLTAHGRWLAAVLACGPDAVLSHLSAAALWGLLEVDPVVIDVTAPRTRKRRDGIRLHRPSLQPVPAERCVREGVPVTTASRTFFDLAALVGDATLTKALRAGERHGRFTPSTLLVALGSRQGRRGFARARRILELHAPAPARFRSRLEADAWALIASDPEIDSPEVNARVGGYEVDWLWRRQKLIVELDGGPWHRTAVDRRNDSARDTTLESLGYLVLRFSDEDIDLRPTELVAAIKATLAAMGEAETSLIKDGDAIVAEPRERSRTPSSGVSDRPYQR